ncbi:MAG: AmmeMemoRadiSam system protein B, partial [Thermoprotei archaeon]
SFKIVPISMLLQDLESSKILGKALAKVLRNRNAVIIASTDFTHYEPHDVAKEKDMKAIECILRIDPELLFKTVRAHNISMCGVGPVATMLVASKLLGASVAQLLKYATSGDITGDKSQVVGYGSLAILK